MTNSMPKYLQAKFNSKKATTTINPEHENFVRKTIKRMFDFNEVGGQALLEQRSIYLTLNTHLKR
jgi:hypothetical protein